MNVHDSYDYAEKRPENGLKKKDLPISKRDEETGGTVIQNNVTTQKKKKGVHSTKKGKGRGGQDEGRDLDIQSPTTIQVPP